MKKTMLLLMMVLMLALQACQPAAPPPPAEPPPPPPPTPEEITAQIRPILEPMRALLRDTGEVGWGTKGKGAAGRLSPEIEKQVLDALTAAKQQHQGTENGKAALNMITHDVEEIASQARDQDRWTLTMGAIKAFELLQPGNTKMNRLKERATLMCKRPIPHLKGFLDDKQTGETYAFIEVELLPDHELKQVKVRKGEEFYNLRFLDIIGNNEAVTLEYTLVPGNIRECKGPKR